MERKGPMLTLDDMKPKRMDIKLDGFPDLLVIEFEGERIATSRGEIMLMLRWLINAYQKGEIWKD